jgi:F-type H+-transporting ATPase subunit delta
MKNLIIARRYAKALLLIGKEDGQAETYRDGSMSLSRQFVILFMMLRVGEKF